MLRCKRPVKPLSQAVFSICYEETIVNASFCEASFFDTVQHATITLMVKESGLSTQYDRNRLLIIGGVLAVPTLLVVAYAVFSSNPIPTNNSSTPTTTPVANNPINVRETATPTPDVLELPEPTPRPTLNQQQRDEMMTELKKLNIPEEGFKEIEDYFNNIE